MNEVDEILDGAMRMLPDGPPPGLMRAISQRADAEGLLDVAYSRVDSPLGSLTAAVTERGLVLLSYPEHPLDEVLGRLSREISPRVLEAPARTDVVRRQLDEYFGGERRDFDLAIDWSPTKGFFRRVLEATAAIGYGEVKSYAEVAEEAGNARAVRAAGNGLGSNRIPIVVPCHRVLRSGGGLGGYTGGVERKRFLLDLERGSVGDGGHLELQPA